MAARFRPDSRKVLNFGVTSSVYWLRFSSSAMNLQRRSAPELDFPHMDYLDLYLPGDGGGLSGCRPATCAP